MQTPICTGPEDFGGGGSVLGSFKLAWISSAACFAASSFQASASDSPVRTMLANATFRASVAVTVGYLWRVNCTLAVAAKGEPEAAMAPPGSKLLMLGIVPLMPTKLVLLPATSVLPTLPPGPKVPTLVKLDMLGMPGASGKPL